MSEIGMRAARSVSEFERARSVMLMSVRSPDGRLPVFHDVTHGGCRTKLSHASPPRMAGPPKRLAPRNIAHPIRSLRRCSHHHPLLCLPAIPLACHAFSTSKNRARLLTNHPQTQDGVPRGHRGRSGEGARFLKVPSLEGMSHELVMFDRRVSCAISRNDSEPTAPQGWPGFTMRSRASDCRGWNSASGVSAASQSNRCTHSTQFSEALRNLLQSSTNCGQRCRGTSLGG